MWSRQDFYISPQRAPTPVGQILKGFCATEKLKAKQTLLVCRRVLFCSEFNPFITVVVWVPAKENLLGMGQSWLYKASHEFLWVSPHHAGTCGQHPHRAQKVEQVVYSEIFLTPWRQQLSTDSTDFSSSTQPMESWSLSHVHLDRSGLAASLTAQLSRVPMSLFGRRQHILGGAGRRTRTANLPFWRSRGLMKCCQPGGATLSAAPCRCQAGSHSWSVPDSLRCRAGDVPFSLFTSFMYLLITSEDS